MKMRKQINSFTLKIPDMISHIIIFILHLILNYLWNSVPVLHMLIILLLSCIHFIPVFYVNFMFFYVKHFGVCNL